MKVFVPGEIARAEDVNANFAELKEAVDRLVNGRQHGTVHLGQYQPNESYEASVTFPRPFTSTPHVAVSCGNQRVRIAIYDITPTGFKYYGWNDTGGFSQSANFDWIALAD